MPKKSRSKPAEKTIVRTTEKELTDTATEPAPQANAGQPSMNLIEENIRQKMENNQFNPPEWKRKIVRQIEKIVQKPSVRDKFRAHIRTVAESISKRTETKNNEPKSLDNAPKGVDFFGHGRELSIEEKVYIMSAFHDVFAEAERMSPIWDSKDKMGNDHFWKMNDRRLYIGYCVDGHNCANFPEEKLQPAVLQRYCEELQEALDLEIARERYQKYYENYILKYEEIFKNPPPNAPLEPFVVYLKCLPEELGKGDRYGEIYRKYFYNGLQENDITRPILNATYDLTIQLAQRCYDRLFSYSKELPESLLKSFVNYGNAIRNGDRREISEMTQYAIAAMDRILNDYQSKHQPQDGATPPQASATPPQASATPPQASITPPLDGANGSQETPAPQGATIEPQATPDMPSDPYFTPRGYLQTIEKWDNAKCTKYIDAFGARVSRYIKEHGLTRTDRKLPQSVLNQAFSNWNQQANPNPRKK